MFLRVSPWNSIFIYGLYLNLPESALRTRVIFSPSASLELHFPYYPTKIAINWWQHPILVHNVGVLSCYHPTGGVLSCFLCPFFSGWWYINPSEKLMGFVNLVRQLGLLFPIYGKS